MIVSRHLRFDEDGTGRIQCDQSPHDGFTSIIIFLVSHVPWEASIEERKPNWAETLYHIGEPSELGGILFSHMAQLPSSS